MSTLNVRVNAAAKAVHVTSRYANESLALPVCGAPGNTPGAHRAFRPVVTDEAVTCKRCLRSMAAEAADAGPSHDPAACSVRDCTVAAR